MTNLTLDFAACTAFFNGIKITGEAFKILTEGIKSSEWANYENALNSWHYNELKDHEGSIENDYYVVFKSDEDGIYYHDIIYKKYWAA